MLKLTSNGAQPSLCTATPQPRDTPWQSEWMDKPMPAVAVVVERRPLIRDLITHCLSRVAGFAVAAAASIDECTTVVIRLPQTAEFDNFDASTVTDEDIDKIERQRLAPAASH